METVIYNFFFHNWKRKALALVSAAIVWLFVNQSITEVKTISNVPIRIINLPSDKTIQGLLPNGILSKRITLTLTGTKDVIEELEPGDVEVLLDASLADQDDWIVRVTKKNLVSLNPSIDLVHHITQIENNAFVIKLSRMVTDKIPVTIVTPIGSAPSGYEYLDVWPQHLTQTVSGPEEEIHKLKEKGIELAFDLKDISKIDLDNIKNAGQGQHNDEISFAVPKKWKFIAIPFHNFVVEELNDPEAQNLRIDFLRKEFLPLKKEIPLNVFYPLNSIEKINPENLTLAENELIKKENGINLLTIPLYTADVSRLFIDVIRNYIEIAIVASPQSEREVLNWSLQFVNPAELENTYVAFSIANSNNNKREELLRKRFREYMQRLTLFISENEQLHLHIRIEDDHIVVTQT